MAITQEQQAQIQSYFQTKQPLQRTGDDFMDRLRVSAGTEKESQGLVSRLRSTVGQRVTDVKETFEKAFRGEISPVETGVRVVGDVIGGAGEAAFDVAAEVTPDVIKDQGIKLLQSKTGQAALSALQQGTDAYEGWKTQNKRAAESIEGVLNIASILPITKGGQIARKVAGRADELVGAGVRQVVPTAKKAGKGVSDLGNYAVTQLTGLEPGTVKLLVNAPEAITKAQKQGLQRITLARKLETAMGKRIEDLSEVGQKYDAIRQTGAVVTLPQGGYKKFLEDTFKIKITPKNKIEVSPASVPMSKQDKSAIQEFLSVYGANETFTVDEFLNVRKALDNVAGFGEGKTSASKNVSKKLRAFHDKAGKNQIEGLRELDLEFGTEANILKDIKKDYFTKDGELKPGSINKIANIGGTGADLRLEKLKKILPNIEKEVKILKVIENLEGAKGKVVGAYVRGGLGAAGAATGNLAAVIGSIVSSPSIAVPLLKKFGKLKGYANEVIEKITKKITKGENLNKAESVIVTDILQKVADTIGKGGTAGLLQADLPDQV